MYLPVASRSIIQLRQVIDLQDTDKSQYFASTEFDNKQLLDEVFVISGIIKVEVSVISRSRRLRLITLTEKPFLFFYYRSHSYFAVRELDIAVRALDIALGNHALRVQPADYSLICRYRLVNNL